MLRYLQTIKIRYPGSQERVPLSDHEKISSYMNYQYPGWDTAGNVLFIPSLRRDRTFLKREFMDTECAEKHRPNIVMTGNTTSKNNSRI